MFRHWIDDEGDTFNSVIMSNRVVRPALRTIDAAVTALTFTSSGDCPTRLCVVSWRHLLWTDSEAYELVSAVALSDDGGGAHAVSPGKTTDRARQNEE